MNPALNPVGPVTLITLDDDAMVTESDVVFEALIGPGPADDVLDVGSLCFAELLGAPSADRVLRWCRTGHDDQLGSGLELRGRRRDGLPLLLRAYGVRGAFASSPGAVVDARRPHRRLLLQRAGGAVAWTGGPPPPFPPRTGPDHVLAHDLRGQVRTARTFLGVHQRRLAQAVADARAGGTVVPDTIASDPAMATSVRALSGVDEVIEALVRFERLGTDPLVVGPVRLVDVVGAAADHAHRICDALSEQDGQDDLAGGLDIRWDGPADLAAVADPELLTWVITELLVNARKFGRMIDDPPTEPAITIKAGRDGSWIDLRVMSRGRVIDPELAIEAWSLGRQLQPRGERPGAGLGLPLCERIVARHGGHIAFLADRPGVRTPVPVRAADRDDGFGDDAAGDDAAGDDGFDDDRGPAPTEPSRGTTIVELQLLAEQP